MRISLRHVAERAGVSDATVSRVLNGVDARIAPDTRMRVRLAAAEIGYQPNRAARALATGRTQTLALWAVNLQSPHASHVIYSARKVTTHHDFDLMISGYQFRDNNVLDTSRLMSWPVDGVMAIDIPRGEIPGLEGSLLGGKPFVSMGVYVLETADHVQVDFRDKVIEAVRHLHERGCRRIAYLMPDWLGWFRECNDARVYGYEAVMEEIGQPVEFIITPQETRQAVGPSLKEHIRKHGHPDGLFCFNDNMAIGALRALRDLDLRIPQDVALIGCDGIDDSAYLDPSLTTIAQPLEEMCEIAWSFLEARMKNPDLPVQQATLYPTLEIRGSSMK